MESGWPLAYAFHCFVWVFSYLLLSQVFFPNCLVDRSNISAEKKQGPGWAIAFCRLAIRFLPGQQHEEQEEGRDEAGG